MNAQYPMMNMRRLRSTFCMICEAICVTPPGCLSKNPQKSLEFLRLAVECAWLTAVSSEFRQDSPDLQLPRVCFLQTDGWLSTKSASLYEHSTESLFLGRQDAMQRAALVPLVEFVSQRSGDALGSGMKLLEVACGTGRFHTYIKVQLPGWTLEDSCRLYQCQQKFCVQPLVLCVCLVFCTCW